jgi:hypothetical protein
MKLAPDVNQGPTFLANIGHKTPKDIEFFSNFYGLILQPMKSRFITLVFLVIFPAALLLTLAAFTIIRSLPQEDLKGKYQYKDFETALKCRSCHPGIYEQWSQAMMSQAYTHHWDEIEYFELVVPHAEVNPALKDPVDGCNGCHSPMAYMVGKFPLRVRGEEHGNESVSCEVCH